MATLTGMRFHDDEGGNIPVVIGGMTIVELEDSEFKISIKCKPWILQLISIQKIANTNNTIESFKSNVKPTNLYITFLETAEVHIFTGSHLGLPLTSHF